MINNKFVRILLFIAIPIWIIPYTIYELVSEMWDYFDYSLDRRYND